MFIYNYIICYMIHMILNFMEGHWQNLFEPVRPDFGVMQDISYTKL